jgi:hypothetical protein
MAVIQKIIMVVRDSVYKKSCLASAPRTPKKDPYWYSDSIKGIRAVAVQKVLTVFKESKMFRAERFSK